MSMVAPARERGLKLHKCQEGRRTSGRSREGAWIEIWENRWLLFSAAGRSREGAWIEIAPVHCWSIMMVASLPRGSVD